MTLFNKFLLPAVLLLLLGSCEGNTQDTSSDSFTFDSSLVAHWKLDDTVDNNTTADTFDRNTLQLTKKEIPTTPITGKIDYALNVDGQDDAIINLNITDHLKPPHLTLSGWVRVIQGRWQWIAAQGDNYGLFLNNNHQVTFYIHHNNIWIPVTGSNLKFTDNQWHHLAGSYDGNTLRVYFDGLEVAHQKENRAITYTRGNQFTIGSMQGERVFLGDIDDVRVYQRALTNEELRLLAKVSQSTTKLSNTAPEVPKKSAQPNLCGASKKPHFYVSPQGNDQHSGNLKSPWKTLSHAAKHLKCGTLHIKAGIYKENVTFTHSGTAKNFIKILAEDGAIVDGSFGYDDASQGLVTIKDASYIILDGLTVRNALTHGIYYEGTGKHIQISHCRTEHTRGSGIYIYGEWPFTGYHISDVIIKYNDVHWPQEGAFDGNLIWQEDITLAGGIENFDVSYNYVNAYDNKQYHVGPIGIDVKAGVRNGVIHHNEVENIPSNGIYVDAGGTEATNIKVYKNIVKNVTGYGIPVAGEDGGKIDNIEIFDNVTDTTGYSGIAFYNFDPNSKEGKFTLKPRTNIKIYNNTINNAGATKGWGWGIMTESQFDGEIFNNVIANSKPSAMKLGHSNTSKVTNNCIPNALKHMGDSGNTPVMVDDPMFLDPKNNDFSLKKGSPCQGFGIRKDALKNLRHLLQP